MRGLCRYRRFPEDDRQKSGGKMEEENEEKTALEALSEMCCAAGPTPGITPQSCMPRKMSPKPMFPDPSDSRRNRRLPIIRILPGTGRKRNLLLKGCPRIITIVLKVSAVLPVRYPEHPSPAWRSASVPSLCF